MMENVDPRYEPSAKPTEIWNGWVPKAQFDALQALCESHAAELNRRRGTDSAVRQTLRECGAPDNHSIHLQIEWLAKRNVRRRRLLEQAVTELLDQHGNHTTAALGACAGCRLIAEIREEATQA